MDRGIPLRAWPKNLGFGGFVEAVQQMRSAYWDGEDWHDIVAKDADAESRGFA
jgi:hypothetical protein